MTELLKEEGCTPDLVERLRTMTAMINMGEKVSMVYETELRHRAAAEIERLRNENGNLRHNCAVAKIGHDQLNRFIRMLVGVGAPTSMPIDAQVEWACKEIERLRTKLAEAERIVSPAECDENCDDPDCPYSHVPLTRQAAYENSASRRPALNWQRPNCLI